jgi:heme/copper-type cytochrome/quinol oxidase subunit 2
MTRWPRHIRTAVAVAAAVAAGALWTKGVMGSPAGNAAAKRSQVREIVVTGDQYSFAPGRIEVQKDDLVHVKFTAKDIAHSFTIDVPYRISKRAGPGQSVVFEFRADEAGRFTFYCNLTQDDRCKQMKGELVVR